MDTPSDAIRALPWQRRPPRRAAGVALWLMTLAMAMPAQAAVETLRVCADADNLPFSNARREGFENRIAELIAAELQAEVTYTWSPMRRGFLRRTLGTGSCDVVLGAVTPLPGLELTQPYYTTSYTFVAPAQAETLQDGLDSPALRHARIGLHAMNVEGSNPPPARALLARGLQDSIVGFLPWGRAGEEAPQARIIDAVATGEVDVAVVWGPIAGYFARRHPGRLRITTLAADPALPDLPFAHAVSIGVRTAQAPLREAIQSVLNRRRQEIRSILEEFGVPLIETTAGAAASASTGLSQLNP